MKRPRYVKAGDTRSPMLRFLSGAHPDGSVEVNYDAQWRTMWKAQRMGLLDDSFPARLTEAGRLWLESAKGAK